jgi:DNA-binding response OmpR family regulator
MARGRVIIVDDDESFLEALAIFLGDHGFGVVKAQSGREAIAASARHVIDLAILDIHLPDVDGTEVAREIRRRQPETSVILISSDDSPETARKCRAASAEAFLPKPLVPEDLLAVVQSLRRLESRA